MDWYEAIILGIVQGLTEWLPISSSGHLAIAERVLNLDYPIVYDIAFDEVSGRAFIATESGISILHTPFGGEPQLKDDNKLLIRNS